MQPNGERDLVARRVQRERRRGCVRGGRRGTKHVCVPSGILGAAMTMRAAVRHHTKRAAVRHQQPALLRRPRRLRHRLRNECRGDARGRQLHLSLVGRRRHGLRAHSTRRLERGAPRPGSSRCSCRSSHHLLPCSLQVGSKNISLADNILAYDGCLQVYPPLRRRISSAYFYYPVSLLQVRADHGGIAFMIAGIGASGTVSGNVIKTCPGEPQRRSEARV